MEDEFEVVELEYSEEDILYYLVDEDDNEVGFVLKGEDGEEVECYYDDYDADDFEVVDEAAKAPDDVPAELAEPIAAELRFDFGEGVFFVYVDDELAGKLQPLEDAAGAAVGEPEPAQTPVPESAQTTPAKTTKAAKPAKAEKPAAKKPKSYAGKLLTIAGAELGKARDAASVKVEGVRTKAEEKVGQAATAAKDQAKKAKAKVDDYDLGITRESVAETTSDLNAIAKEGAEVAGELKAAYDDIMGTFSFLKKK